MSEPTPQSPPRHRLRRLALGALVAAVVLLIAAEITLRAVWGFGSPILYRADPDAGYIVTPNQHVRRFGKLNVTNSVGMRSPEIAPHKPPGITRVMFLGNSITYGTSQLDQSQIFTALLQARLPAVAHGPVEVLNASAGNWSPFNELGYLRSRGTFESDLVVQVIYTADLVHPMATLDPNPFGPMPTSNPVSAIEELLIRYGRPWLYNHWYHPENTPSPEDGPVDLTKVPPLLEVLNETREICVKAGARYAIVFTPDRLWANRPDWLAVKKLFDDWAQARHVPVLDMTDEFLSQPPGYVFIDTRHLEPGGHELIARRVIENWPTLIAAPLSTTTQP